MLEHNKKKIFCIIQLPPPVHGVSLMNSYVINSELIKKHFSLKVIDMKFAKNMKELEKFSFAKVFKTFFYGFKIIKEVISYRPDLVYFTIVPTGLGFYRDTFYVFLLKLLNQKILFHLHGKGIKEKTKSNLLKHIYSWVFKNTYVICLSRALTTDIDSVYRSRPFIVPNGIQVNPHFDREINRVNGSVPTILFLSNYIRAKGILVLIEALGILKKTGYLFKVNFVGAPYDLSVKYLEAVIAEQDLTSSAKVLGPLHGEAKIAEFQKADIFVFPTYNESFGLVNLEAMQYSLPIVSTFEGSIPDIVIDNETGLLAETRNAEMLANQIAVLLKDKELRISMGKKGYDRFINNYTLNHFESNMNTTFQAVISAD